MNPGTQIAAYIIGGISVIGIGVAAVTVPGSPLQGYLKFGSQQQVVSQQKVGSQQKAGSQQFAQKGAEQFAAHSQSCFAVLPAVSIHEGTVANASTLVASCHTRLSNIRFHTEQNGTHMSQARILLNGTDISDLATIKDFDTDSTNGETVVKDFEVKFAQPIELNASDTLTLSGQVEKAATGARAVFSVNDYSVTEFSGRESVVMPVNKGALTTELRVSGNARGGNETRIE